MLGYAQHKLQVSCSVGQKTIRHCMDDAGMIHPNVNLEDPEDEVDLNIIVGTEKQRRDVKVALSNSFGFGGHNSSIIFKAFAE